MEGEKLLGLAVNWLIWSRAREKGVEVLGALGRGCAVFGALIET